MIRAPKKKTAPQTARKVRRKIQPDLFDGSRDHGPNRKSHGGDEAKGQRKLARPLERKHPLLLTLRAEAARGALSMLNGKHRLKIKALIEKTARRWGVRIHRYANVGNHLHLRISLRGREAFQNFLRTIAALIARLVTGARKGKPFGKFWDALAHSRVLASRREALYADRYVEANEIEAAFGQEARKTFLRDPRRYRQANRSRLEAAGIVPGTS